MAEITFKTLLSPVAPSSWAATIARSAPTAGVRLLVVRLGAATLKALSSRWWICRSMWPLLCCAGEWPAITVSLAKVGALTPSVSVGANRFRASHRLHDLALRRRHAPWGLHRQALTVRQHLHRHLAQ